MYNSIKLKNIKGVTAEYKLFPVTIITGENGSGKSAILDGIISSLLGYHPRLGKKHSELSRLCSALPASVEFGPNGWTADAKGKVDVIPSRTPASMLDLADFFGKTARERTQIVLEASGARGDVSGVIELLPTVAVDAVSHLSGNPSEWFNSAIEALSKLSREAAADAKRSAEFITQSRKSLPPQVANNPDELSELTNKQASMMRKLAEAESTLRSDWDKQLAVLTNQSNIALKSLNSITDQKSSAFAELKALSNHPSNFKRCPTCGKAMGVEVAKEVTQDAIQAVNERIAALDLQYQAALKVFKEADEKLQIHQSNKPAITDEIMTLKTNVICIEAQIKEAQQRSQDAAVRASKINAIRKLETESASKTMEATQLSAALKTVKDEADKFMAAAVGPVLRAANQLVENVFDFHIDFSDGEFGYRKGEVFVSKTLSGAEQLAVYAGLQLALCGNHSPKILIVDELGRLSPGRKVKFMKQVNRLVQDGVINQFIGCDVNDSMKVEVKEA